MLNRWYVLAIFACWAASMGWLFMEKILPTLRQGERPEYAEVLPDVAAPPRHVNWQIQYNGKNIGRARNLALRNDDGSARMDSTVEFDDLPLSEIMSELLGTVGTLLNPLLSGDDDIHISMVIDSKTKITAEGNLDSFSTDVRMAEMPNLIRVEGEVQGGKLQVEVQMADEKGEMRTRFRDEVEIADGAMVSGTLSPQDRFGDLHVGQKWTMPVYRPFPPNSPVQMLEATVECYEVFLWNERSLKAFQVVYRDDAGSGITIAREPIGRMWVRDDGVVLQQEARIANMRFRFIRQPNEEVDSAP